MPALTDPLRPLDPATEVARWAASGAMSLTGRIDRDPLGPPAGLVTWLDALGGELRAAARAAGGRLEVDPLGLLSERAAIAGLSRRGTKSVGGATRLLPAADTWLAVSLARPDDVALVPAWLELESSPEDPWAAIASAARTRPAVDLVARARLLGLPAAELGEAADRRAAVLRAALGAAPASTSLSGTIVLELASLWAGPLCGSLLQMAGATVIKVESTQRPDGARRGPPAFFDLLNAGKRSMSIDLSSVDGRRALAEAIARADVVIEGSRPRALEHLGVRAVDVVGGGGPRVWVSITGHGREEPGAGWVAFGDDAAVAGGLVAQDEHGPVFCADAIADPLSGTVAAAEALRALASGGRWLLDVSLAAVAASVAGPTRPVSQQVAVAPPASRAAPGPGPRLGAHDAEVLGGAASGGWGR